MANHRRIALALNNLATVLQQLAVELTDQQTDEAHPLQLTTAQLREALIAPPTHVELGQQLRDQRPVVTGETKASVAEPACACSLYARCDEHAGEKRCKCNGPHYRSSACLIEAHRVEAAASPRRDPALLD